MIARRGFSRPGHPRARPAQVLRRRARRRGHRLRGRRAARSSACSAPTAPARRRPSRCSRATASARAGSSPCSATTPAARPRALRERVGIVLQSSGIYRHATPRELVTHWAGFYPRAARRRRGHRRSPGCASASTSSRASCRAARRGGWTSRSRSSAIPSSSSSTSRRPASIPAARRAAWDTIRALADLGKTVLLTTHYLDEAQALCDRVAIVKDGRILAVGAPAQLGVGASSRYRVSWRDESGELVSARDRRPDRAAAPAHERRARARHRAGATSASRGRRWRTSTSSSPPRRAAEERGASR